MSTSPHVMRGVARDLGFEIEIEEGERPREFPKVERPKAKVLPRPGRKYRPKKRRTAARSKA